MPEESSAPADGKQGGKKAKKSGGSSFFADFIVGPYLAAYSLYQSVGWAPVVATALLHGTKTDMWPTTGANVTFFQNLGLMEVAHGLVGFTRSSPFATLVQIYSRIFLVSLLNECPSTAESDLMLWKSMMLFAWSLADTTRYVFHVVSQSRDTLTKVTKSETPVFEVPYPLLWLRYSLFIVLYPMGVSGELRCVWQARQCLVDAPSAVQPSSISGWVLHANRLAFQSVGVRDPNVAFGAACAVYAVGLPGLYMMLLGARRKNLGKSSKKETKEKSG